MKWIVAKRSAWKRNKWKPSKWKWNISASAKFNYIHFDSAGWHDVWWVQTAASRVKSWIETEPTSNNSILIPSSLWICQLCVIPLIHCSKFNCLSQPNVSKLVWKEQLAAHTWVKCVVSPVTTFPFVRIEWWCRCVDVERHWSHHLCVCRTSFELRTRQVSTRIVAQLSSGDSIWTRKMCITVWSVFDKVREEVYLYLSALCTACWISFFAFLYHDWFPSPSTQAPRFWRGGLMIYRKTKFKWPFR